MASHRPVPLTMGSARFHSVEADGFRVTDAWFPPGAVLERHAHDRTTFAVMVDGGFDLVLGHGALPCPPATVFTEPLGEPHGNRVGRAGAHVLVIQPDPARPELFRPVRHLLDGISHFRHAGIVALAARLARELRAPDGVSVLAIEALGLEMLTLAARADSDGNLLPGRPPAWLNVARDYVHEQFHRRIRIQDVAAVAGVHPIHLSRVFRRHTGTSLAAYVRRLRLEWAAATLRTGDERLSRVALQAGFADQSHFTRAFRAYIGVTPARYRRAERHQNGAAGVHHGRVLNA